MSKVINAAPITVAVNKLESRIAAVPHQDAMQARTGATNLETRASQEQGSH
jgi:hypothetical protein